MSATRSTTTAPTSPGAATRNIALVGNPNTGKTTVFNALTGLRQKIGNYPGVTVEKKTGTIISPAGQPVNIHDLPGLYSLAPKSLDDKITADILRHRVLEEGTLEAVIIVVDATNLGRNLYLVTQILDLGLPTILAVNMIDTAQAQGFSFDLDGFARDFGVPVLPVIANRRTGVDILRKTLFEVLENPGAIAPRPQLQVPEDTGALLAPLVDWLQANAGRDEAAATRDAIRLVSSAPIDEQTRVESVEAHPPEALIAGIRERFQQEGRNWQMLETQLRYRRIDELVACHVTQAGGSDTIQLSDRLDRILTHRILGPILFLVLFALIFQSIFTWAEIPMTAIEEGVAWVGGQIESVMPPGTLRSLIVDGAIAGVGAILVFLPQILFLFFFLSLLEDTGYMSRVAFMADRVMKGVGLSGRSVIPLLSSFACAIPGIMATRTIQNWKDRLVTIMIAPFMSCSARLPVYVLMIGAFIPNRTVMGIFSLTGLTLLSMYLLGIVAAVLVALIFKRFLMQGQPSASFIMELPPYRRPSLRWTLLQMWDRGRVFVTDAGKIILAISIVLWFMATYPRPADPDTPPNVAIQTSFAGQIGKAIEPAIEPLGFDWKIGIGLLTSFAAREVLVSTMATIYNVEGGEEDTGTLREALRNDRDPETGKPTYTPLVAISLMVFFVLACQCMATVAIVKRETNSWRWPLIMIGYMTALAYLASLLVYQGGKLFGWG